MRHIPLVLISILVLGAALPAGANEALKQCRSVQEAAARLACYDALPLDDARAPATAAPTPASPRASSAPVPRAAAPAAQAPVGPGSRPPAAATAQPSLEASFGLEGRSPAAELPAIQSHIPGTFLGWSQYTSIRLANGQVWQVIDEGSRRMQLQDAKVRVRRGMMGAFYLEFEAHNHAPRVRRVE